MPEMEPVSGYEQGFQDAGFILIACDDLSSEAAPNWDRVYGTALGALAKPAAPMQLVSIAASVVRYGERAVRLAKEQFLAALLAKAAADAGILRYVAFLAERR